MCVMHIKSCVANTYAVTSLPCGYSKVTVVCVMHIKSCVANTYAVTS
jgi:copper chaperone CopZ